MTIVNLSGGLVDFSGRWFVSHGGQFGLGISYLCADGTAGDLPTNEADAIGADDEVGD